MLNDSYTQMHTFKQGKAAPMVSLIGGRLCQWTLCSSRVRQAKSKKESSSVQNRKGHRIVYSATQRLRQSVEPGWQHAVGRSPLLILPTRPCLVLFPGIWAPYGKSKAASEIGNIMKKKIDDDDATTIIG